MREMNALNPIVVPILINANSMFTMIVTPIAYRGRLVRLSTCNKSVRASNYLLINPTLAMYLERGTPPSRANAQSILDAVARIATVEATWVIIIMHV